MKGKPFKRTNRQDEIEDIPSTAYINRPIAPLTGYMVGWFNVRLLPLDKICTLPKGGLKAMGRRREVDAFLHLEPRYAKCTNDFLNYQTETTRIAALTYNSGTTTTTTTLKLLINFRCLRLNFWKRVRSSPNTVLSPRKTGFGGAEVCALGHCVC